MALVTVDEVRRRLDAGERLLLAGDASLLAALPPGEWIGGTIPYFMTEEGGSKSRDRLWVTPLPEVAQSVRVAAYDLASLSSVYLDIPRDGFAVIILPSGSPVHREFALGAPTWFGFATRPLIGWIAGVDLDELATATPEVFGGEGTRAADRAIVMHVRLGQGRAAEVGIVNLFAPGYAEHLTFAQDGFVHKELLVNGVPRPAAAWVRERGLDLRLPLVADYCGTSINVSFQRVDDETGEVVFYAPVFAGVEYRQAAQLGDYVREFDSRLPSELAPQIVFSCNCILNYLYGGLEGRQTGGITGPITFGEVAYQLLNQTLVYLVIVETRGGWSSVPLSG